MFRERLKSVGAAMRAEGVSALLTTHPPNIRFLTGCRGEDAALLVRSSSLALTTSALYLEEARLSLKPLSREGVKAKVLSMKRGLLETAVRLFRKAVVLGVEEACLSYVSWKKLRKVLPKGSRIKATDGFLGSLRRSKDQQEVRTIRRAVAISERAMEVFRRILRPGMTELEAARGLEGCLFDAGAEGLAFPIIVASGPNSSRPHHVPGSRKIGRNDLVLVDWGARYGGYCSDLTRVLFMGRIRPKWREAYQAVLASHEQAAASAARDVHLSAVDRAARVSLRRKGLVDRFLHGLGHGVGLEIHEAPWLSARSKGMLASGDCFTIEPGVYFEGKFGIRLEDDYWIDRQGRAVSVSRLPRDLEWASLGKRRNR